MTRALPRTNFHSSEFLRCLVDLSMLEPVSPGNAFAEKLGGWIHFADAISLAAVHDEAMVRVGQPATECISADGLASEFARVQTGLRKSIMLSFSANPGRSNIGLPGLNPALPMDLSAVFTPYRRFYEAHQRDMELRIPLLRVNVREVLGKASPRLRKLGELDAVLERVLRDRERQLLSKPPQLLKKRFADLFKTHQQLLEESQLPDDPVSWMKNDAWLARFCKDMQTLLLAELALRLQPTVGLIEAFNHQKPDE